MITSITSKLILVRTGCTDWSHDSLTKSDCDSSLLFRLRSPFGRREENKRSAIEEAGDDAISFTLRNRTSTAVPEAVFCDSWHEVQTRWPTSCH